MVDLRIICLNLRYSCINVVFEIILCNFPMSLKLRINLFDCGFGEIMSQNVRIQIDNGFNLKMLCLFIGLRYFIEIFIDQYLSIIIGIFLKQFKTVFFSWVVGFDGQQLCNQIVTLLMKSQEVQSLLLHDIQIIAFEQQMKKQLNAHHRRYYKVKQLLNQQSIMQYLHQHQYYQTIKQFQQQLNSRHSSILHTFDSSTNPHNFQQFVQEVENMGYKHCANESNIQRMVFYLYVWGIRNDPASKDRINDLMHYIEHNGQKLSEIAQLLPYFAIPYLKDIKSHPMLSDIYSQHFSDNLRALIMDTCGLESNSDSDWYMIVKDLIQLSNTLIANQNQPTINYAIDKIKQYNKVLQRNTPVKPTNNANTTKVFEKLIKKQHQQQLPNNTQQLKIIIKNSIYCFSSSVDLQYNLSGNILNSLRKKLVELESKDKLTFISEIAKYDILSIGQNGEQDLMIVALGSNNNNLVLCMLKLAVQLLKSPHGKKYLLSSISLLPICIDMLAYKNNEVITLCLNILYRLSPSTTVCEYMIVNNIFGRLDVLMNSLNLLPELASTYFIALLTNLVLTNSGRVECLKTNIFQKTAQIVIKQSNKQPNEFHQFVNACLYSLMSEEHYRKKAKQLKLQEIFTKISNRCKDKAYKRQIQYIIDKINNDSHNQQELIEKESQRDNFFYEDDYSEHQSLNSVIDLEDIIVQYHKLQIQQKLKENHLDKQQKIVSRKKSKNKLENNFSLVNYKKENYEWRSRIKSSQQK